MIDPIERDTQNYYRDQDRFTQQVSQLEANFESEISSSALFYIAVDSEIIALSTLTAASDFIVENSDSSCRDGVELCKEYFDGEDIPYDEKGVPEDGYTDDDIVYILENSDEIRVFKNFDAAKDFYIKQDGRLDLERW